IQLPPLRDRRDDIPLLTAAFISECSERTNRRITGVSAAAERLLQQAAWPGNVPELRNRLERACITRESTMLSERGIAQAMKASAQLPASSAVPGPLQTQGSERRNQTLSDADDSRLLSTAHRAQIERVLRETRGNKTAAARLLGISRRSLYRWIDRLNLGS